MESENCSSSVHAFGAARLKGRQAHFDIGVFSTAVR
jgi:hypothetical protein